MARIEQIFTGYHDRMAVLEATYNKNSSARGIAWIEGELIPIDEARIPLLDQDFMHSDLTYDMISCTEPEYKYRTVRLIQGIDLEHTPEKLEEEVKGIPRGQLHGRFPTA
jgi:hypothetical protein